MPCRAVPCCAGRLHGYNSNKATTTSRLIVDCRYSEYSEYHRNDYCVFAERMPGARTCVRACVRACACPCPMTTPPPVPSLPNQGSITNTTTTTTTIFDVTPNSWGTRRHTPMTPMTPTPIHDRRRGVAADRASGRLPPQPVHAVARGREVLRVGCSQRIPSLPQGIFLSLFFCGVRSCTCARCVCSMQCCRRLGPKASKRTAGNCRGTHESSCSCCEGNLVKQSAPAALAGCCDPTG